MRVCVVTYQHKTCSPHRRLQSPLCITGRIGSTLLFVSCYDHCSVQMTPFGRCLEEFGTGENGVSGAATETHVEEVPAICLSRGMGAAETQYGQSNSRTAYSGSCVSCFTGVSSSRPSLCPPSPQGSRLRGFGRGKAGNWSDLEPVGAIIETRHRTWRKFEKIR